MSTISEVKQIIAAADVCGHVPLIKGVHGLGKSEAAAQYAKEQDMYFEPLILSLMDTGDMLGLPDTAEVGGMRSTVWAAPSWYSNVVNEAWPKDLAIDRLQFTDTLFQKYAIKNAKSTAFISREDLNSMYCSFYKLPADRIQLLRQENVSYMDSRRSLVFLDEFNRAPSDILNASLQLILDHRLHSHLLPVIRGQETLLVAAINPADGDYTVQEFDPALLDRFVTCEVTPDLSSWLKWAKSNNVNKIVTEFLIDNQNKFHFTPKDGSKGASPRSWTRLAGYIDHIDATPKNVMTQYMIGTVGASVAAQFLMFYNSYGSGVTTAAIEKIIKKEITSFTDNNQALNPEQLSKCLDTTVQKLEAIRRIEFTDTFVKKYINKKDKAALPLLVFLYALPIESLSAVLKNLQTEDVTSYVKLAQLDKEANNKKLFVKLVANLKT